MSETSKKRSLDKLFGTKDVRPSPAPEAAETPATPPARPKRRSPKPTKAEAPASKARQEEKAGPGGYLGEGRYQRGGGVMEKPSIYVRPDQARALRMAAALKDDPNGKTMSEIIQSLLDQNGYCDPSRGQRRLGS